MHILLAWITSPFVSQSPGEPLIELRFKLVRNYSVIRDSWFAWLCVFDDQPLPVSPDVTRCAWIWSINASLDVDLPESLWFTFCVYFLSQKSSRAQYAMHMDIISELPIPLLGPKYTLLEGITNFLLSTNCYYYAFVYIATPNFIILLVL